MHDDQRSGRRPIDFFDIRILVLLDEQPFHSTYSIAEALCISQSTILSHLRESLGKKSCRAKGSSHCHPGISE
jgi:hypothetical protein